MIIVFISSVYTYVKHVLQQWFSCYTLLTGLMRVIVTTEEKVTDLSLQL
jgi:hypothetical protein